MNETLTRWPELEYSAWKETCETIHLWSQIVGKIKVALCLPQSHWWHVALHVTQRGISSGPIPYSGDSFEIEFDFMKHQLVITTNGGRTASVELRARSVKLFYEECITALSSIGIDLKIDTMPKEIAHPIRFDQDEIHSSYDSKAVEAFRVVLLHCDSAFREFKAGFCGKSSPVMFFWGSFDLTFVRFSGRHLPSTGKDGGVNEVEEEFAVGFWPGSESYPKAAFYAYALPSNPEFYSSSIMPKEAHLDQTLGEFILDYEHVRTSSDPHRTILEFAQSAYESLANLANWDRDHLERVILEPIPS